MTLSNLKTINELGGIMADRADGIAVYLEPGETAHVLALDGAFGPVAPYEPPAPPAPTLESRLAELAVIRLTAEIGGITVPPGILVPTDRESAQKITAAIVSLDKGLLVAPIKWKMSSGWIDLSAEMVTGIGAAVAQHVQLCFEAEAAVAELLEADLSIDLVEAFAAAYAG